MKFILDISGFSCVWSNQSNINSKTFPVKLKQRLIDIFIQGWSVNIKNSLSLNTYSHFKDTIVIEKYIEV